MLSENGLGQTIVTVVVEPGTTGRLGLAPSPDPAAVVLPAAPREAAPFSPAEREVAKIAVTVIDRLSAQPDRAPTIDHLRTPEVQAAIIREIQAERPAAQPTLEGVPEPVDVAAVVARTCDVIVRGTIGIPRILLIPKELSCGFHAFTIDFRTMRYAPVSEELWIQHLSGSHFEVVSIGGGGVTERRLEDYVVRGLVDFSDVDYDRQADLSTTWPARS